MTPFNLLVWEESVLEIALSTSSPPGKKGPTSPKGASSTRTQRTPSLPPGVTVSKKKDLANGVHKVIKTSRTPTAADILVHGAFKNTLDLYMPASGRIVKRFEFSYSTKSV